MKTHEKPATITAHDIMDLRRRTGMGVLDAKHFLETSSPLLYSRFIEAIETNNRGWSSRYDPIEDDPEFTEIIQQAEREAEQELLQIEEELDQSFPETVNMISRRRSWQFFELTKQRILREKYQIEWFTTIEMNPGDVYSP